MYHKYFLLYIYAIVFNILRKFSLCLLRSVCLSLKLRISFSRSCRRLLVTLARLDAVDSSKFVSRLLEFSVKIDFLSIFGDIVDVLCAAYIQ